MHIRRTLAVLALSLFVISGTQASGSDDAAAKAFRGDVEDACRSAAAKRMKVGSLRIDPHGTETYGMAVITEAGHGGAEHVCVFDRTKHTVEIGGALEIVTDTGLPFSETDREQLAGLPDQVRATLADISAGGLSSNGQADTVLAMIDGKIKSDPVSGTPPGPYLCTVYWYGFLDEGARKVGSHQCRISRAEDGGLFISKVTGDRLFAETVLWGDNMTAFAGRSFLPEHQDKRYDPARPDNLENPNYGNKVGLVLRSGERVFMVSTDGHGMTEPDATFFEILELIPRL